MIMVRCASSMIREKTVARDSNGFSFRPVSFLLLSFFGVGYKRRIFLQDMMLWRWDGVWWKIEETHLHINVVFNDDETARHLGSEHQWALFTLVYTSCVLLSCT